MTREDVARRRGRLASRRASLTPEQQALFAQQLTGKTNKTAISVPRRKEAGPAPLSFYQQRLWFLYQWHPHSTAYNIFQAIRLEGYLDIDVLRNSFHTVIKRHDVFRTLFAVIGGEPKQIIKPDLKIVLPVVDLCDLPEVKGEMESLRLAAVELELPFDLMVGPLIRCVLVRMSEADTLCLLTMHHIISDGWSMGVFIREVALLYHAYSTKRPFSLPALPIQYVDYAVWQRQSLQGDLWQTQLAYWQKQLANAPQLIALPTDRPRPPVQTFAGSSIPFRLSVSLSKELKNLSQTTGTTLFMLLETAFAVLLGHYSRQTDILIGTPVANRNVREVEHVIGFFVNTVVLRNDLSGNPTFRELLIRVRQMILEAQEHQALPFETIVQELQPDRDPSHNPLFQVVFTYGAPPRGDLTIPGVKVRPWGEDSAMTLFDLVLGMGEDGEHIVGGFTYNTDLFNTATMRQMLVHFQSLLEGVAVDPDRPVMALPSSTDATVLAPPAKHPDAWPHTLYARLPTWAAQIPDKVALTMGGEHLTYGALSQRVSQVAASRPSGAALAAVKVVTDAPLTMLIEALGVLQAGGKCVLGDAAGTHSTKEMWPPGGLVITHEMLMHRTRAVMAAAHFDVGTHLFMSSGITKGIMLPLVAAGLLAGAMISLAEGTDLWSGEVFTQQLSQNQATAVVLPARWLRRLPTEPGLPHVKTILTVGDPCWAHTAGAHWAYRCHRGHIYGNEVAMCLTTAVTDAGHPRPVLGQVLSAIPLYVLDEHLQPVSLGMPGELYIGEAGGAQTYLHQGMQTDVNHNGASAQVFHPVWGTLYKTKELVRRLPDGKIELLGAADASVMARGRRLEPGLVEGVLAQHPAVYEAVVFVRQKVSQHRPSLAGEPYLIAYVVLIDRDAEPVLRVFLKERLPSYLIPVVVCLDGLPLTGDGRVDLRALPVSDQGQRMLESDRTNPLHERITVEVSLKRNNLQERQAKLSAVKQALLAKKLQKELRVKP